MTFAPSVVAPIHPIVYSKGFYDATIAPDQLPQAVNALTQYRTEIFPKSRTVSQILRVIGQQGGQS